MAITFTYSPTTHTAPETATVAQGGRTVSIQGLTPGACIEALNDQWAAATVWLPTATGMQPFSTSGSVTVT